MTYGAGRRRCACRGLRWRAAIALLASVSAVFSGASLAAAHGGSVVVTGADGGYRVLVRASPSMVNGRHSVDLTAYVAREQTGAAEVTARVVFTVAGAGAPPPLTPSVVDGAYESIVPVPAADTWRDWTITATISGDAGTAQVSGGPLRGSTAPDAAGRRWLPAGVGALGVCAGLAWWWSRRRVGGADADEPDAWDAPAP
jgi:hypothetical protein